MTYPCLKLGDSLFLSNERDKLYLKYVLRLTSDEIEMKLFAQIQQLLPASVSPNTQMKKMVKKIHKRNIKLLAWHISVKKAECLTRIHPRPHTICHNVNTFKSILQSMFC